MTEPEKEAPTPRLASIPLDEWSGAGATKALHETIKDFTATSDRQAKTMINLTRAILALTVILALGLCMQLWLAWMTITAAGVVIR
jgi:hypothetical protein